MARNWLTGRFVMRLAIRQRLLRFARSAGVGVVATVADLVLLVCLVELADLSPVAANLPALSAGLLLQFVGNKLFAFRDRSRAYVRQGLLFALIEVGALALNGLGFHLIATSSDIPYPLVRALCSALVYVAYSYPLWAVLFRPRHRILPRSSPAVLAHRSSPLVENEPCST